MATDTITAVPTITTVRSKNPTTMSRKGDSVRARLLNNMGIFKGATTPSQSAAPNPAIERKMKIIRAMGMGGVIPTKPPTRDDFQQKSGNGMMMMMADGSINMNASGNEARFRPKIDFDKITEEALKYTDYKWDDNDIDNDNDDLHHDHESVSVSEENDLDNDNDNDNHMLDLVGDCDASASSVGSRSTSTSRSRSNSNVSTGSAMSICSNGSTAASSRPGDSVVDDSSDSSSFKPKTIGVGAVSVAVSVSVSVSANASTVSASASSTTSNTKPTRRKARISFNDSVAVAHIPMRSEYSDRVRSRLWSNRYEIHENATRNAIEFQAEGWDWRSVTEDEGMFVCTSSGELIHPVHCQQ